MRSKNRIAFVKLGLLTAMMSLAGCFTSLPPAPTDGAHGEAGTGAERPGPDAGAADSAAGPDAMADGPVLDTNRAEPDLAPDIAAPTDVTQPDLLTVADGLADSPAPDVSPAGTDVRADLATPDLVMPDLALPDVPVVIPDASPDVCIGVGCGGCSPSSLSCNGLQPRICDATGAWTNNGVACKYVCNNATGACSGACSPGQKQCTGSQPQTCDSNGAWQDAGSACSGCYTCSATTGACGADTGTSCDDSNACTTGDTCQAGVCAGTPVTCSTPPTCHGAGTCNPSTGACTYPPVSNTSCDDLNSCTQYDTCQSGTCVGTPVTCTAGPCQAAGTCSAGTCPTPISANNGTRDPRCLASTPVCVGGLCTQCFSDSDCSSTPTTPSCDPSNHTCACHRPSARNLVQNPGFDTSLAGWSASFPPMVSSWTTDDSENCPGSGSVAGSVYGTDNDPMQCVPLSGAGGGAGAYYFGAKFKLPLNGNGTRCEVAFASDQFCSSFPFAAGLFFIGPNGASYPGSGWQNLYTTATAPAGTASAYISCSFDVTGGTTEIDQIYLNKSANNF